MRSRKPLVCLLFVAVLLFAGLARGQGAPISKPTITSGPDVWTQETTASFSFTSPDNGVRFECRLDDDSPEPCSDPWAYSSVSEGDHIFLLKAILDDQERQTSWEWTVDLTPPALPRDMTVEATSPAGTPVAFQAQDNLDAEPDLACTPASGSTFPLGTTDVTCTATDAAGNSSGEGTFAVTVVDTTPPAAVLGLKSRFGDGWIKLLWNKPVDADYSHVGIWRKRAGSSDWRRVGTRRGGTTYLDDPVPNDVRFQYALRSIDLAGNRSSAATVLGRASRILSPRYGAVVGSPPLIDWTAVRSATYYNMQLWREGQKILSVWPGRSSYRLRADWTFAGRHYALRQGIYRVYVWPGFGAKSAVDYGGLLGWTSFTVG